ncbi:MAG: hypothetical protein HWN51_05730, partial [Desulfobacterales bacterium]|nr:hypothetical protein [Desulfobacterales bacterium]
NGYPGMGVLLLSLFAGAATGINLFLVVKLVRKKITISSAAIAHSGVGLMFLGIVSSSAYDCSEKVLVAQETVQNAMGYEIKFNGPTFSREGKGMRLHLPLDVKKGETHFIARPDIYSERSRNGQVKRFTHPYIRRGLLADLYISPVDYDPGQKKSDLGNHLHLKKGNTARFHGYELTFTGFDVSAMMGKKATQNISVGANIVVSYKGAEPVKLTPVITVGQRRSPSSRVKLPGPEGNYLTLVSIDATAKTVGIVYHDPASAAQKSLEKSPPAVIAEVSVKPGMTLLWLGTFLILLGAAIGIVRRWPK